MSRTAAPVPARRQNSNTDAKTAPVISDGAQPRDCAVDQSANDGLVRISRETPRVLYFCLQDQINKLLGVLKHTLVF
jgi:hypothetical protein